MRRVRSGLERRHRGGEAGAVLLTRSVAGETLLLAAVLAVTSALVATTPATASYRPTQEHTVTAGPVSVQLTAVPVGAWTVDVHLYVFGSDGLPADVQDVDAEAARRSGGSGPVVLQLLHAGTGHFLAGHVLLPDAGTWLFTLTVRTGEFDAYAATTTLKIR
jgi:nitrogen fixation protein FixH